MPTLRILEIPPKSDEDIKLCKEVFLAFPFIHNNQNPKQLKCSKTGEYLFTNKYIIGNPHITQMLGS